MSHFALSTPIPAHISEAQPSPEHWEREAYSMLAGTEPERHGKRCGCVSCQAEVERPTALFPLPVDPEPVKPVHRGGQKLPDHLISLHGHCADFCAIWNSATDGESVEEHGPYCQSQPIGGVYDVLGADGTEHVVDVALVSGYTHGTYEVEDLKVHDGFRSPVLAELVVEPVGSEEGEDGAPLWTRLYLSEGQMRTLAAALVRAADTMHDPGSSVMQTKAERQRSNPVSVETLAKILPLGSIAAGLLEGKGARA